MARSVKPVEGDESVHYVSARMKRKRPPKQTQPPLTPMIDVVFQLLIFFLLGTSFREQEGLIPATLPEKGEAAASNVVIQELHIEIHAAGAMGVRYYVRGENMGIEGGPDTLKNAAAELHQLLAQRQERHTGSELSVLITPAPDVRWEFVVEAFNQAVRAGFKKVGFVGGG